MDTEQPEPADVRLVPEHAYKFGVGPILVHSVEVVAEVVFDNQLWLHVRALVANGDLHRHGRFVNREIYLNAAALPDQETRNASGRAP